MRVASIGCRRFGSVEVRDKGRSSVAEEEYQHVRCGGSDCKVVTEASEYPYVYRWNRAGRKGALCKVTARGTLNSARVEFEDGFVMITSRNALKRAEPRQKPRKPRP